MAAAPSRKFTIAELVLDSSIELPIIAEVQVDYKDNSLLFKKGDLLWLIQLVEEDDKNDITSVEGSRWDAPDFLFSLKKTSKLTLSHKTYSTLKDTISFGPALDISGLTNITKPSELVFGIPADDEGASGVLGLVRTSGRVVVHDKERVTGFLAKGVKNSLIIPGDYEGRFTQVSKLLLLYKDVYIQNENKTFLRYLTFRLQTRFLRIVINSNYVFHCGAASYSLQF